LIVTERRQVPLPTADQDVKGTRQHPALDQCRRSRQPGWHLTAEDECIINYVRAGGTLTRTITIDANNDVWVGGLGDRVHEKVNGMTGERVEGSAFAFACGGYGGFIDGNGILWSMTSGGSYLRYDTNTLTGSVGLSTTTVWVSTRIREKSGSPS
jgi:hypothetical protein